MQHPEALRWHCNHKEWELQVNVQQTAERQRWYSLSCRCCTGPVPIRRGQALQLQVS
jgi:hypothetical protein